jgi:hypothetical protein
MRRVVLLAAVTALVALPLAAQAKAVAKAAPKTWTGEVVDAGCYMAEGARATGEGHKECAGKCFSNGMPAGFLTSDGKLVLLVPDHKDGQAYKEALSMPGEKVELSGVAMVRNGLTAVTVTGVKRAEGK